MARTREHDIISFAVMSFIAQIFISLVITLANTPSTVAWNDALITQQVQGQTNTITDKVNDKIVNDTSTSVMGSGSTNPLTYFVEGIFGIGYWLGGTIGYVMSIGWTYITLSVLIANLSSTGMASIIVKIIAFLVVIWQLATARYILKMMLGNRFGSG